MKKIQNTIILVAICLFAFANANAQWESEPTEKPLSFGPKIALGGSTAYHEISQYDWTFTYSVGVFMNYKLSKGVFIHPELNFQSRGYQTTLLSMVNKYSISYIDIPILARVKFASFHVLAGPYFDYKISDEFSIDGNNIADIIIRKHNSFDIGIAAGAEIALPSNMSADVRVNFGITELKENTSLHNISATVGLSYHF